MVCLVWLQWKFNGKLCSLKNGMCYCLTSPWIKILYAWQKREKHLHNGNVFETFIMEKFSPRKGKSVTLGTKETKTFSLLGKFFFATFLFYFLLLFAEDPSGKSHYIESIDFASSCWGRCGGGRKKVCLASFCMSHSPRIFVSFLLLNFDTNWTMPLWTRHRKQEDDADALKQEQFRQEFDPIDCPWCACFQSQQWESRSTLW